MLIVENLKNANNIKDKNKSFIIPLFRKQIFNTNIWDFTVSFSVGPCI